MTAHKWANYGSHVIHGSTELQSLLLEQEEYPAKQGEVVVINHDYTLPSRCASHLPYIRGRATARLITI